MIRTAIAKKGSAFFSAMATVALTLALLSSSSANANDLIVNGGLNCQAAKCVCSNPPNPDDSCHKASICGPDCFCYGTSCM